MSDSMEKSERLTAREIEEEEMKRELTGIGIYEPGFTYKEMKRLLEFVNESQDTSNVTSNNKNTQQAIQHSDNECLSDVTSDINVQQEVTLQKCTEMPKPSYSYKLNHTSPTMHERRAVHYINSPESSPLLFEVRSPIYKSSDNDEQFEKQCDNSNSHTTNRYFSLRLENVSRGCQNATEKKMAQETQSEIVQKLERWRLNPLDVCINENDVPLRQLNRSSARERMPFEHCKEAHMSDQCDRVIRSVNQHLEEMANLWYSWRPIINPIFQWGSPIQVSTANSSLDKKPLTNPKTEQIQAECTYRDGYERASKRKANTLIATLNRDSSSENEDDNQYDFIRNKKKRIQSNDKSNVEYVENQHAHASYKKENVIAGNSFSDDNSNTNIDNEYVKHSRSPELTTYPRRIRPPNPQTRLSLARKRKENATSKLFPKTRYESKNVEEQTRNQKKDNTMTEEEIRRQLEEDWSNDEEKVCAGEKDAKFRPTLKEVRYRLRDKRLSLNKKAKETRTAVKEEKSDEEQNKIKRLKFCERRKIEELCRIDNRNGSWEHELLSDEDKSSEMNQFDFQNGNRSDNVPISANNINCPICNKCFPHNEIENHAADCEQFETNNEEDDNDRIQFECNICSNYKTNNGKEYEEHVYQCINIKNNQRYSHGSEDINITSTSSIKTNQ
ncbi:PREDICTED: uncharacterized protein LOC108754760 isoform X1 [Trachymyrmex septentrionalis]|uniref:uncharacterized protein LOC108754760 isoform X1 n=1 Tax=Trachymyrmex septentrionalis TaxID=34720 RepID=UPI00084EF40B|nr:PREDICTED: uncharacterized protein LOC108754760 isoform X1 [Trachymyrmex septentrionalis]